MKNTNVNENKQTWMKTNNIDNLTPLAAAVKQGWYMTAKYLIQKG